MAPWRGLCLVCLQYSKETLSQSVPRPYTKTPEPHAAIFSPNSTFLSTILVDGSFSLIFTSSNTTLTFQQNPLPQSNYLEAVSTYYRPVPQLLNSHLNTKWAFRERIYLLLSFGHADLRMSTVVSIMHEGKPIANSKRKIRKGANSCK